VHYLEAGTPGDPVLLLLHGFPELAFSWRRVMVPLAQAGFRVIAPDQRGYGETTGWDPDYHGDIGSFRFLNLIRDLLGLLKKLEIASVHAVVGHDFGSPLAAWAALVRPGVFPRAVLMSAPFGGPPAIGAGAERLVAIDAALSRLARPRNHYQAYYCTERANRDMWHCPQGVHDFLRAYFHMKSGDWAGNAPHPLEAWEASALAELPDYYVMDRSHTMPEAVAPAMPSSAKIECCPWLTEPELRYYSERFERTGFQGGLNGYRCQNDARFLADLEVFDGCALDVPTGFIGGASDWGVYQSPGALERMERQACPRYRGTRLIEGAGHWVQQERPEAVVGAMLELVEK